MFGSKGAERQKSHVPDAFFLWEIVLSKGCLIGGHEGLKVLKFFFLEYLK